MLKLIKYEFKTIGKEFLIILGAIILLNIALMTRINVWSNDAVTGLSFLIAFGAAVAVFIYNIMIFTRDLKRDTGYLLFSIPKSGYTILGAKLSSSLIVMIVAMILGAIMTFFVGVIALGNFDSFIKSFTELKSMTNVSIFQLVLVIIVDAIIVLLGYVECLLNIYLAVTISKVIMNGRKFSGLVSFLIYIIINLITGKIYELLSKAIPQTINPYITTYNDSYSHLATTNDPSILLIPVNWAGGIFYLMVIIGLFIGIGYMLEKKIDL